ncbi:hypothetical protein NUW54_g3857 [Trametes sanguinea]|uniref:Uncharacterized protein n=1 Tax=Trametes sanguinea TaxID=158606 RepID=A0ACC1Q338_9APHY|nr:hypothetical protein NUW54_g3857 [Trametes sanguinea]
MLDVRIAPPFQHLLDDAGRDALRLRAANTQLSQDVAKCVNAATPEYLNGPVSRTSRPELPDPTVYCVGCAFGSQQSQQGYVSAAQVKVTFCRCRTHFGDDAQRASKGLISQVGTRSYPQGRVASNLLMKAGGRYPDSQYRPTPTDMRKLDKPRRANGNYEPLWAVPLTRVDGHPGMSRANARVSDTIAAPSSVQCNPRVRTTFSAPGR